MPKQHTATPLADLLRNPETQLTDGILRQFSDLDPATLKAVLPAWGEVQPERRRTAVGRMAELFEEDTRLSFEDFARAAITDPDPLARAASVRLLAESDDPDDAALLVDVLKNDADLDPRLQAARALAGFVELGELEELAAETFDSVVEALLKTLQRDEPAELRRACLESVGFSSRPEVVDLTSHYLANPDSHWVASALRAVERSGDSRWNDQVVELLMSPNDDVRMTATEAAGSLYIEAARPLLLKMLEDEDNPEVYLAIIWSLSQIGGEDVEVTLESLLEESDDDDLVDFVEEALENLAFNEGGKDFPFLEIEPGEDADED